MEEPKIRETDISELKFDPHNPRIRTAFSSKVIEKSLEEFGACRSIVIDETGTVRAGNGTLEQATQLGIEKVIIVETTGKELVAVKRSGLTDEQWTKYTVADNTSSDFSSWDAEILAEIAERVEITDFFPEEQLDEILGENNEKTENSYEPDNDYQESSNAGHTKEINPDEFEFSHQCPKCGFQFNGK